MPEPLTKIERRILDYLVEYLRTNTYQPSIREVGRRFDIKSTKTVSEHLQSLADKGWIERDPSRSRGVRLLGIDLHPETVTVSYFGEALPDGVTLARDGVVEEYEVDRKLAGASGTFMLAMVGNSMDGLGILDGDLLVIEPVPRDELETGDIVVARLAGGEATVKQYFERDDEIVLEPANSDYPPTLVRDPESFSAMGRVTGVVRRLRSPAASARAVVEGEAAEETTP